MPEEKSTRDSLSAGEYRSATAVAPPKSTETDGSFQEGRVVSSSHTPDTMTVRITTRPTNVRHPTE